MIYSDGIHIISDVSRQELDDFCQKIGIKKCWFHPSKRFPHYDIPMKMKDSFFQRSKLPLTSSRDLVRILKAKL